MTARPANKPRGLNMKIALSIKEAAEASSFGERTLWRKIKSGEIPARKDGGRTLILYKDLEAYIEALPAS